MISAEKLVDSNFNFGPYGLPKYISRSDLIDLVRLARTTQDESLNKFNLAFLLMLIFYLMTAIYFISSAMK